MKHFISKHQGMITIASAAIGFSALALTSWMGWESLTTIDNKTNIAAVGATMAEMNKKIDWLLQRNGANPEAIKQFINPITVNQ